MNPSASWRTATSASSTTARTDPGTDSSGTNCSRWALGRQGRSRPRGSAGSMNP